MEQKYFFEKIKLLLLFSMNIHGYSSSSPINFSKKLYFQKKNPVLLLIIINGIIIKIACQSCCLHGLAKHRTIHG